MSDYADLRLDPNVLFGEIEADSEFAPTAEESSGVDTESFLAAMRVLAGGVVMVTARAEDRVWGLTISSCCSISAGPPQILISLDHGASARPVVLETRRFGVSILRGHQKPLAELGAVPGGPKHVDAFCERRGEATATMLAGALYHLDCRVEQVFEVSDHTLIVGAVETAIAGAAAEDDLGGPLLYFNRTFFTLGRAIA
jgi:flavin reductase ActVB